MQTITSSNGTEYKEIDGTFFHVETPIELCHVLNRARENRTRIIVDYGDVETGKSWGETYDIAGYVGRSTGSIKVPLLVHNSRSLGGGAMLDHCILTVKASRGGALLYRHN